MSSGKTGGKGGMQSTFEGITVISLMCSGWNGWRRRIICGACGEKEEKQRHICVNTIKGKERQIRQN